MRSRIKLYFTNEGLAKFFNGEPTTAGEHEGMGGFHAWINVEDLLYIKKGYCVQIIEIQRKSKV